jgi:hypothetical protein
MRRWMTGDQACWYLMPDQLAGKSFGNDAAGAQDRMD